MTYSNDDPNLRKILYRLKSKFILKKTYLFGSRAKGQPTADSDYDLLVIIENSDERRLDREAKARDVIGSIGVPVDVFVYTQSEFDEWKDEFSSIPETALREGFEVSIA